jgi:hypothetical protein
MRPFKIYPNWDFGFENKPSGIPGPFDFFGFQRNFQIGRNEKKKKDKSHVTLIRH